MKVDVFYDSYEEITRDRDPDDDWDNDDTCIHTSNFRIVKSDTGQFELPRGTKIATAVVANYCTGDTFGRYDGQIQVLDVFDNDEDAAALAGYLSSTGYRVVKNGREIYEWEKEFKGKKYYCNWFGYFEHLNSMDLHTCLVQRG